MFSSIFHEVYVRFQLKYFPLKYDKINSFLHLPIKLRLDFSLQL